MPLLKLYEEDPPTPIGAVDDDADEELEAEDDLDDDEDDLDDEEGDDDDEEDDDAEEEEAE